MIFVDFLRPHDFRGKDRPWCHMASNVSVGELHEFANGIGMRKSWFQNKPGKPHYDLVEWRQRKAIDAGAALVSTDRLMLECARAGTWTVSPRIRASLERSYFRHSSGLAECAVCGKILYDHPSDDKDDFLVVDCLLSRHKL